ncbi:MAG: tagatose-bisphosphate aldolase [Parcubacteria group bacterium]|nr:tagatose-bisphosphate aldolase [Parcubacteria group bacterium]|tara:strand:+ start:9645 stop:10505 length:861 start_codon:yes stop_codon:yes gene_type:complete
MMTLKEVMQDAFERKVAVGHFNISDSNQLNGIAAAARELSVPVIIGVSEGEAEFVGLKKAVAMVRAAGEEFGINIFINADHAHSVEGCKRAIDAGFDSVIFDGSKLPLVKNIASMKEVVGYANQSGREVMTEGEVGYIGTSSKILDDIPDDVVASVLPTPDNVASYVQETGVTAVAPAVGNLHGMLKGRSNPALNIELIQNMRAATDVAMVLHGGSGLTDDDFRAAIAAGMNVIHINTEIRVAYRKGIEEALAANPNEVAPYRYLNGGRDALQTVVRERLKLFNNL